MINDYFSVNFFKKNNCYNYLFFSTFYSSSKIGLLFLKYFSCINVFHGGYYWAPVWEMHVECSDFRLGHCSSGGDHPRPDIAGASLKVSPSLSSEERSHQHNGPGQQMGFIMHIYADTWKSVLIHLSICRWKIHIYWWSQQINLLWSVHSLLECSSEKSSLCLLKSNNGSCDNVMLGESVTLLFSPLGFWQKAKLVLTVGQRARRGGPFININILSFLLFASDVYKPCPVLLTVIHYLWWCLQLNSECLVLKLARHFNSHASCDEKISRTT